MRTTLGLALIVAIICQVSGKDINAIVKYNTKIYAFDGYQFLSDPPAGFTPSAFVVVGNAQTNALPLSLPNTTAVIESSQVIGNTLYQFSGAYGIAYLSKYSLPLTASTVTPVAQIQLANQVQEIPAVFDSKDSIAVALISRYLTLVTLSPMAVTDSTLAVVGSKKFPGALVYNSKNNKVYYFQTNYCFAGFCQHIYEFKVNLTSGKLNQPTESFQPDYNLYFNTGALSGCSLDSSNNVIWCLNADTDSLFKFPVSNLNSYTYFSLPSAKYTAGNVAFDFTAQKAYVTVSNDLSFTLNEVSLTSGSLLRSSTFSGNKVVSLYASDSTTVLVGHAFKGVRQMSVVSLATFTSQLINLYA